MIDHEPARSIVLVFHSIPFAHRTHPQISSRESQLVLSLGLFMPGSAALDGLEKRELFLSPSPPHHHLNKHFLQQKCYKELQLYKSCSAKCAQTLLSLEFSTVIYSSKPILNHSAGFWKSGFKFISCSRAKLASFHHF